MQNGLLTGKFTMESIGALDDTDFRKSRNRFFRPPDLEHNLTAVEALRPIAAECDMSLAQLALAWVLRRPEVTSAITGTRKAHQIEESAQAADMTLEEETLEAIEAVLARREERLTLTG
jgi:aryl-alcohol dehydrogenase-like predicted oxidoreductase